MYDILLDVVLVTVAAQVCINAEMIGIYLITKRMSSFQVIARNR